MMLPPGTDRLILLALEEDLGTAGDITTNATIPAESTTTARIVAREAGRIAGLDAALRVFDLVDGSIRSTVLIGDGADATAGAVLAQVSGPTRSILTGERVALNLLGHLSGVATATRDLVDAIAGNGSRLTDTRKTTPGLRALEKQAVRSGGGVNHRFGLDDAALIKDNHLAAVGSVADAVERVRRDVGHTVVVEVEATTLDQVSEAVEAGADIIMLDNMEPATMREAVALVAGRCTTEASGGISADTIQAVAETGVDVISVGAITHSAKALDVALEL
jgi:nicotinate-nucleotide pyrophosphorylase (carboxylating)